MSDKPLEVNTTAIIAELYRVYDRLNHDWWHNELPSIFLTINPGTLTKKKVYGMFSPKSWGHANITEEEKAENRDGSAFIKPDRIIDYSHEISLSPEYFLRPIENWVATLQHEMVHLYCEINDILDTSNNGVYHNKRFAKVAREHGLEIEKEATIGWSVTNPSPEFASWCDTLKVDTNIFTYFRQIAKRAETKVNPKKRYICPTCGMVVQAKKNLNIRCGACDHQLDYWDISIEGEEEILADYNEGLAKSKRGWYGARQLEEDTVIAPSSTPNPQPDTDEDEYIPGVDYDENGD